MNQNDQKAERQLAIFNTMVGVYTNTIRTTFVFKFFSNYNFKVKKEKL